jgi:hypothetical protein
MGKVGSTAVFNSLKMAQPWREIHHVHQLSETGISRKESWYRDKGIPLNSPDLLYPKSLRHKILSARSGTTWQIISLTREPASLEISGVFQNLDSTYREFLNPDGSLHYNSLLQYLESSLLNYNETESYYSKWFDEEMKEMFGIDVYESPFDFRNRYMIYETKGARLLLMRMEDLNSVFSSAFFQFLGVKTTLSRANDASAKWYQADYKRIREHFQANPQLLKNVYQTRYARHFYPEWEDATSVD